MRDSCPRTSVNGMQVGVGSFFVARRGSICRTDSTSRKAAGPKYGRSIPFQPSNYVRETSLDCFLALVTNRRVDCWPTCNLLRNKHYSCDTLREAPPARNGSIAQGSHHFAPPAETHTLLEETAKEQDPMPRQPLYGAVVAVPHDNGDSGKPCDEDDVECNAGSELGGSSNHTSGRDKLYPGGGQREPGVCGRDGILAMPNVKMLLLMAPCVQVISIGFEEVYPLWALSTPDVGGLGWNIKQIGQVGASCVSSTLGLSKDKSFLDYVYLSCDQLCTSDTWSRT